MNIHHTHLLKANVYFCITFIISFHRNPSKNSTRNVVAVATRQQQQQLLQLPKTIFTFDRAISGNGKFLLLLLLLRRLLVRKAVS